MKKYLNHLFVNGDKTWMSVTKTVVDFLIKIRRSRTFNLMEKESREICALHKEWKKYYPDKSGGKNFCTREGLTIYKNTNRVDSDDDRYYVSDGYYQADILPRLNSINYGILGIRHTIHYFTDKNYEPYFMQGITFPQTLIKNIRGQFYTDDFKPITYDRVISVIKQYSSLVFKKTVETGHGNGVALAKQDEYEDKIKEFKRDFLIQVPVKQHEVLSYFNDSSVNVLRITSLCHGGEVYILGVILRVGPPGAFCDLKGSGGQNPRLIAVKEDGSLGNYSVDPDTGSAYEDVFGKKIQGVIPNLQAMKEMVRAEHIKYPGTALIGWDFTVDIDGNPICFEYNSCVPGIVQSQMVLGPIFAQKSKDGVPLLEEIMK